MNVFHKWTESEPLTGEFVFGDQRLIGPLWTCKRCGAQVRYKVKPHQRKVLIQLSMSTNCEEETVRRVLES